MHPASFSHFVRILMGVGYNYWDARIEIRKQLGLKLQDKEEWGKGHKRAAYNGYKPYMPQAIPEQWEWEDLTRKETDDLIRRVVSNSLPYRPYENSYINEELIKVTENQVQDRKLAIKGLMQLYNISHYKAVKLLKELRGA